MKVDTVFTLEHYIKLAVKVTHGRTSMSRNLISFPARKLYHRDTFDEM